MTLDVYKLINIKKIILKYNTTVFFAIRFVLLLSIVLISKKNVLHGMDVFGPLEGAAYNHRSTVLNKKHIYRKQDIFYPQIVSQLTH